MKTLLSMLLLCACIINLQAEDEMMNKIKNEVRSWQIDTLTEEGAINAINNLFQNDTTWHDMFDSSSSISPSDPLFGPLYNRRYVMDTISMQLNDSQRVLMLWISGLPRMGALIDNANDSVITMMDYFSDEINPAEGIYLSAPELTNDGFDYVTENHYTVKIMNMLTGNIDMEFPILPSEPLMKTKFPIPDEYNPPPPYPPLQHAIFDPRHFKFYDMSELPAGMYFFTMFDELGSVVYFKTYVKK